MSNSPTIHSVIGLSCEECHRQASSDDEVCFECGGRIVQVEREHFEIPLDEVEYARVHNAAVLARNKKKATKKRTKKEKLLFTQEN